jgi:hypothetical protein
MIYTYTQRTSYVLICSIKHRLTAVSEASGTYSSEQQQKELINIAKNIAQQVLSPLFSLLSFIQ